MRRALVAVMLAACGGDVAPAPAALGETRPGPVVDPVVDPAAAHPRVALLSAESQAVLRDARLPLLLPREPELLRVAIVTAGPHFTALSAQGDGFSLSISGTDARFEGPPDEEPPPEPVDRVRGRPAVGTVNDGIRTITWDEATIAWAVDVECEDPENDPRCTEEDFIRALVESLETVGGGP